MRILLAYKSHAGGAADPYTSLLPVGLGYINACLRLDGHRSSIANLSGFSRRETEKLLKDLSPEIVGISQFTHNRRESILLAELVKKVLPSSFVVFGGPHATHRSREIMTTWRAVDAVVVGEGEETFRDLAMALSSGERRLEGVEGLVFRRGDKVVVNAQRERIVNLDSLPEPARHFEGAIGVDLRRQLEFIITSRGCPYVCRFCSSPGFWGRKVRFRSPRAIVDEIRYNRDRYGIIYFSIRDDTFTADRERVLEFCRLLVEERLYILWNCQSRVSAVDWEVLSWMKRAGCECVQYGIESGSTRILEGLGKRIDPLKVRQAAAATRRAGINLSVYLITGVAAETEEDVEATLRLLDDIRPNDGQVSPLAYYPGTRLFEDDVAAGAVRGDIFETDGSPALLVRKDPFVARSTKAILSRLARVADRGSYRLRDFLAHKRGLGYCHATNVLAGEFLEGEGKWGEAEREYREMIAREPGNPWGWLMLGGLYRTLGSSEESKRCHDRLRALVPEYPAGEDP